MKRLTAGQGAALLMALTACSAAAQRQPAREGHVTTPDTVRLWYRVVGAGPETVIAPAALYHRHTLDRIAHGRRLVLYDPRGRGASDTVPPSKASLEHEFRDLETIRRAAGAESFALIGWSALGLEAFGYAARYPGRVTRLIMLAPLAPRRNPYWDQLVARRRTRVDSAAQARLADRVAAGEFKDREADHCRALAHLGDPAAFGDPAMAHLAPDVCDSPNEWPARYARHAGAMLGSYGDYDWRPDFGKVTIPQLVIHGDRDNFPLHGSREWVAGRPNARLLVFPGAGHWLQYERPDRLVEAIDQFLRGRWPTGSQEIR